MISGLFRSALLGSSMFTLIAASAAAQQQPAASAPTTLGPVLVTAPLETGQATQPEGSTVLEGERLERLRAATWAKPSTARRAWRRPSSAPAPAAR